MRQYRALRGLEPLIGITSDSAVQRAVGSAHVLLWNEVEHDGAGQPKIADLNGFQKTTRLIQMFGLQQFPRSRTFACPAPSSITFGGFCSPRGWATACVHTRVLEC